MSTEILQDWFISGRPASLRSRQLWPLPNPHLPTSPLFVQGGQAEAVFCRAEDNTAWILKKCLPGRCPDIEYLEAISQLLPIHPGLTVGNRRQVLKVGDLKRERGCYFTQDFQQWLEATILMPWIKLKSWAAVADDIRDGSLHLPPDARLTICRSLAELVGVLEAQRCAHRDLSCKNVFICLNARQVQLIDFDSLHHPNLTMPRASTCGTEGYIAGFAWRGDQLCEESSWCEHADRYALAVLIVEILLISKGTPLNGDGCMFPQAELRTRQGAHLQAAMDKLAAIYPDAIPLFNAAIHSRHYQDCPSPAVWIGFCDKVHGIVPPALTTWEDVPQSCFASVPTKATPPPQHAATVTLQDLPRVHIVLPRARTPVTVALPSDPWMSNG